MTNLIALSSNQTAWLITLAAGLVVLLVVLALLETLRKQVKKVDTTVADAWQAGKRVEHNTVMVYLLKRTRERGSELVEELGNHR